MIAIPDDFVCVIPGQKDGRWWVAVPVAPGLYLGLDKVSGSRARAEEQAAHFQESLRKMAADPTPRMFVTADMAVLTYPNDPV